MADIKNDVSTNLVSVWLSDDSGLTTDLHGSNDLTNNGVTLLDDGGKNGDAGDFERSESDYLAISDASQTGLDLTGDWSSSMWLKPESIPSGSLYWIWAKRSSGGAGPEVLYRDEGGTLRFQVNDSSGAAKIDHTLTAGEWVHMVTTYDVSTGGVEIYINGSSIGTATAGGTLTSNSDPFEIGGRSGGGTDGNEWDGVIHQVAIYDGTILSSSDVSTLYNSGNGIDYDASTSASDVKNDTDLSTSLVSYWELEEASGTRVDSHGSNDLTDNNTVGQGTGIQGNAADFEKANSEYLSISDASQTGLDPVNDFSISFWLNPETVETSFPFVKGETDNLISYRAQINSDGTISFYAAHDGSTSNITSTTALSAGTWYHIVFVKRSSGTGMEIYINASSDATGGSTAAVDQNTEDLIFGGRLRPTIEFEYDGLMDEVGFWNKVLTLTEINDLYNSGSGIPYEAAVTTRNPLYAIGGIG